MLSRMVPPLPPQKRTLHLLNNADILCANDTSLSLPYHIGNGIFGGLLPLIGLSLSASTGNIYAGLYYPIAIAALCFVCGVVLLKETGGTLIWNEVAPQKSL